jgi:hypothetical protein
VYICIYIIHVMYVCVRVCPAVCYFGCVCLLHRSVVFDYGCEWEKDTHSTLNKNELTHTHTHTQAFIAALKAFSGQRGPQAELTLAETMQLINLRPTAPVEVHLVGQPVACVFVCCVLCVCVLFFLCVVSWWVVGGWM